MAALYCHMVDWGAVRRGQICSPMPGTRCLKCPDAVPHLLRSHGARAVNHGGGAIHHAVSGAAGLHPTDGAPNALAHGLRSSYHHG